MDSYPSCEQSIDGLAGEKDSKILARAGKLQAKLLPKVCVRPEERETGTRRLCWGEAVFMVLISNCPRMKRPISPAGTFRLPWPLVYIPAWHL